MHADTAQRLVDENVDLQNRLPDGQFDAVRAREGGLDAQFFPSGLSRSCLRWWHARDSAGRYSN